MPRDIDSDLLTSLSSAATSICELLRVKTATGTTLVALTSHTENVTVTIDSQSVTFVARPGIFGSKVSADISFSIDNSEVAAYITSSVIDLNTLYGQRVEGARFERYFCDYEHPSYAPYKFHSGFIGEIPINDYAFKVSLRSLVAALHQPVGTVMQPLCRAGRLGEANTCNFPLTYGAGSLTKRSLIATGTQHTFRVASYTIYDVLHSLAFRVASVTHPTAWFDGGVMTWLTSANGNIGELEIRSYVNTSGTGTFSLQDRPGGDLAPGDTFKVDAGCARTPGHCYYKFRTTDVGDATYPAPSTGPFADPDRAGQEYANGNLHNFQGELHLADETDLVRNGGDWNTVSFIAPDVPADDLGEA